MKNHNQSQNSFTSSWNSEAINTKNYEVKKREFQFAKPIPDLPPVDVDLAIKYCLRYKVKELKEYITYYPEVLDMKDTKNGNVVLHIAASKGHVQLMAYFVKQGANMNSQDIWGNTALHYAVDKSRKEAVMFLLNNGARINMQDFKGNSALHVACTNDDFDLVKVREILSNLSIQ